MRPAQKFTLEAPLAVCSRTNRPCRLVPAQSRYENWMHWLVGGRASATCGNRAVRPLDKPQRFPGNPHPLDSGLRRNDDWCGAGMTKRMPSECHSPLPTPLVSGPVSGYGTCFHSNRSSRLAPAHQVMKSRSCGLVQRIGTADSATPHPDPSGGQAPALHFLIPPSTIGLQIGTFRRWRAGIEVDWRARFRTNDECEGIPTDAGMTNSVAGTIHPGSESGTCFRARLRVSGWRPSPRWRRAWSGSCRGIRAALERVGFRQPGGKGPPRQDGSRTKDPSVPV